MNLPRVNRFFGRLRVCLLRDLFVVFAVNFNGNVKIQDKMEKHFIVGHLVFLTGFSLFKKLINLFHFGPGGLYKRNAQAQREEKKSRHPVAQNRRSARLAMKTHSQAFIHRRSQVL